jgi:hypothetical protein
VYPAPNRSETINWSVQRSGRIHRTRRNQFSSVISFRSFGRSQSRTTSLKSGFMSPAMRCQGRSSRPSDAASIQDPPASAPRSCAPSQAAETRQHRCLTNHAKAHPRTPCAYHRIGNDKMIARVLPPLGLRLVGPAGASYVTGVDRFGHRNSAAPTFSLLMSA